MALPLPLRLLLVAGVGAWAGTWAHRWAARLLAQEIAAQQSLQVAQRAQQKPSFRLIEWIPLAGWWWGIKGEGQSSSPARRQATHGGQRPRRPLIVELSMAAGFAMLYWWETARWGLLVPPLNLAAAQQLAPAVSHWPLLQHLLLCWLMLTASLIDLDEQIIPDQITVSGTLLGLALAAGLPAMALPSIEWLRNGRAVVETLQATSPNAWPVALGGQPHLMALLLAIGCFGLWCLALLPRSWKSRRGWRIAVAACLRGIRRERLSWQIGGLFALGAGLIAFVWTLDGPRWQALLSALLGMVATGGIVWLVRIIGQATLQREAMGFGDVTLMAMIGAFLGWQAGLMVFFIAPFFGLAFGIVQAVIAREWEIPYGPFLCLGTLAVLIRWPVLWDGVRDVFGVPWLLPGTLVVMFLLMALMLGVWGSVKRRWLREPTR